MSKLDEDQELIDRACAGDHSATALLVERLAGTLEEVSDLWAAEGLPPADFYDVVAPAISAAIASYDVRLGVSFRRHALYWLRNAVQRHVDDAPAPLVN